MAANSRALNAAGEISVRYISDWNTLSDSS